MKLIGVLLVGLLAGLCWPQPASAQDLPPGSYLGSCRNVYLQGDTLIATCRRADDDYSARPTALLAVTVTANNAIFYSMLAAPTRAWGNCLG